MRHFRKRGNAAMILCVAVLTVALAPIVSGAQQPARESAVAKEYASTGLSGSRGADMQTVTAPARIARVAYVPGTAGREAWAIGLSNAMQPGWDIESPAGQVVFLRYTPATGWQIDGPPVSAQGRAINPTLFAMAFAPNGEGWAVGADGAILRYRRGGKWTLVASPTTNDLRSISLAPSGAPTGFAVGDGPTVVRLRNGAWTLDTNTALITTGLTAVATLGSETAWAISGNAEQAVTLYSRTSSGWTRRSTGDTKFDGPHPVTMGLTRSVRSAVGSAATASPDGSVWFGGVMYVTQTTSPFGDDVGRPFAIRYKDGTFTSYCPEDLETNQDGAQRIALCDGPFPQAGYDITSMQSLPGGEVFASGLGLFHFKDGVWLREPNSNGYLVSVAFASPTEGWAATTGSTFGAGGAAYSSVLTIGHWTSKPAAARMVRWPQPNADPLEAVAVAPDGSGNALAVGSNGATLFYLKGRAWDYTPRRSDRNLHAIAWPEKNVAWTVGARGTVLRYTGSGWTEDPGGSLTTKSLYGVAFKGRAGYAVGADGVILRHNGTRWSVDPAGGKLTTRTLYAITATPNGFLAVGDEATVLENTGSGWKVAPSIVSLVKRPRLRAPALFAATTAPDGSVLIGGAQSALLRRAPGDTFRPTAKPVEGTIISMAAGIDDKGLRITASVSLKPLKYSGDRLNVADAVVLALDASGWHDVQMGTRRSIYPPTNDPSAANDTIYGVATDPDGGAGWAVGGVPGTLPDDEGHLYFSPTSAIYRLDYNGDPSPPTDIVVPPLPPGRSFAFFSDSLCREGVCASAVGSGIKGDVIPQLIREEIELLAQRPNGPEMVLYGGNFRSNGTPEELAQYRQFIRDFDLPVYAALGDRDLFTSLAVDATGQRTTIQSTNSFWQDVFKDAPAPWGNSRQPAGIEPVAFPNAQKDATRAATHYAFNVKDGARTVYRVIVLDSSRKNLRNEEQNPNENQTNFYTPLIGDAASIPTIIVMNQPALVPHSIGSPAEQRNLLLDADAFQTAISQAGVKAVFAGGFPTNAFWVKGPAENVTTYVSGGGGRHFELTKLVPDGYYHSWLLGTLQGEGADAKMTVTPFPILDSLALHSVDGTFARAGNVLSFDGVGRFVEGGFSDPQQSKATYVTVPPLPRCDSPGLKGTVCSFRNGIFPDYEFSTKDSNIAQFVKWDYGRQQPAYDAQGDTIPDPHSGFLCTYNAGTTDVYVRVGIHRATVPVTVDGGFGPCVKEPRPPIEKVTEPEFGPVPRPIEEKKFFFTPNNDNKAAAALFPPIPAPVVAPAPPGSPGVGRKEEHEVQTETEGHGEQHTFTALRHARNTDPAQNSWAYLGSVAMLSFMSAAFLATKRERRPAWERDP